MADYVPPPIPQLVGWGNVTQWRYAIGCHMMYFGLADHIDGTAIKPAKALSPHRYNTFERERIHALTLLTSTTDAIKPRLEAMGWQYDAAEDPKVLWDLIAHVFPPTQAPSLPGLLHSLLDLRIEQKQDKDGFAIYRYVGQINQITEQLAELGVPIAPELKGILAIRALELTDDGNGVLRWDLVEELMLDMAEIELRKL
ncbi:hypothetical protein F4825DRAFT_423598, partial [Nemania diffusa]